MSDPPQKKKKKKAKFTYTTECILLLKEIYISVDGLENWVYFWKKIKSNLNINEELNR
jgi:hypothetical protein